jgi:O-antigen/teichoic acid export membrane protein
VSDLIRHSIFYFIVRVGNSVLAFVALAAFTRLLSPEEYGAYALGMSVATVTSGVLFQ